jgi:hypothetical protein
MHTSKEDVAPSKTPKDASTANNSIIQKPVQTFMELVHTKYGQAFNRSKLKRFLKRFGQFPDKFRPVIWRYLLQLPENNNACIALLGKGVHPAWKDLRDKYPLKSEKTFRTIERVISVLSFWSPLFSDMENLPTMVYPFTQVFPDVLASVETIMSIIGMHPIRRPNPSKFLPRMV